MPEIGRRGKWTAAGAARAARDARIATAAHLRHTPIAQQWEMTRLVSSYQVWQAHLREQARAQSDFDVDSPVGRELIADTAARLLFGGSGLTAPYPDDLNAAARQMLDLRAGDLETATLYVISPSMCDVVIAAAQTLTLDDIALLDADDLPSPAGLLLLPHPILVRTITGDLGDDRALAWTTPAHLPTVTVVGVPQQLPGVRVTSYLDTHGPVRPESFRDMAATATAAGTPLPPLLPDGTRTTAYHMTITDDMRAALGDYSRHARTETARWHTLNTDLGFNEGDQVEATFDYHPGDEINDHDDWFTMRFLYAFWRLCSQGIADLDDVPAGHSARLQAVRAGVPADVRVTILRPTSQRGPDEPGTNRDWQHRGIVRMHKVRQWYPSEQRHKILYRGPYIKGPADKPLLGGEVVRSMTR